MIALVAVAATGMAVYRRFARAIDERPSLLAKYEKSAPAADGVIGPKEYGPAVSIQWTEANTLTAFQHYLHDPTKSPIPGDLTTAPMVIDPTNSNRPDDLSVEAYRRLHQHLALPGVPRARPVRRRPGGRPHSGLTGMTVWRCSSTATGSPTTSFLARTPGNGRRVSAHRRCRRAPVYLVK